MPRPKEKRKYRSSFKSEWMETCDFIEASPGNKHLAFCTICRVDISIEHAGKSDYMKHLKTDKHKKNVESFIMQGGQTQSSSAERDSIYNGNYKVEHLEVSTDSTQQETAQQPQISPLSPATPTVSRGEIHVFGTAEVSCPADRGSVRITVSNSEGSVDDVTNSISRRIDYILQTLRQHDVKDEDTSVRRRLRRDDLYHMDALAEAEDSYHMDAEVTANFSDQEKMEKVCNVLSEKLDKRVCVGQPQFYHSAECLSQLRTSACVTAVENAQQKASKVCHLLKQSLGPPLQLREEETREWKSEEEEEERNRNLGGATPQIRIPYIPIVTVFSRVSATFSL